MIAHGKVGKSTCHNVFNNCLCKAHISMKLSLLVINCFTHDIKYVAQKTIHVLPKNQIIVNE